MDSQVYILVSAGAYAQPVGKRREKLVRRRQLF